MNRTSLARQIVALGFLVALPWRAMAQAATPPVESAPAADAEAATRAGGEAWFLEHIEPELGTSRFREGSGEPTPVLYDPNEVAPTPGKPTPDRRTYRHEARVGTVAVVVLAGDLPPARSQWNDVREWNEPFRPEMFRFYFERVAPTPLIRPD
jgi:hypothetical protein